MSVSTSETFTRQPPLSSSSASGHSNRPYDTLYFAYGSSLSHTQMALRCKCTPERSAVPTAIARLHGWKWIICERGCANVVYTGKVGEKPGYSGDEVWGVLYVMSAEDEKILDGFEGLDWAAPKAVNDLIWVSQGARPTEQGNGRHNKVYLDVKIAEWKDKQWAQQLGEQRVRVLVYIDERDVEEGTIRPEYVGRMNRGIRESVALGLSEQWVAQAMRRWVMPGIEARQGQVDKHG
ncbi:hypothetical protein H2200_004963 [Cladophialophora chaetospira]|uniref:gamma-glutamylcyclotransferase n=1 Tax=Cladophialophora chaetospira TaxID=386627 RepID=A0AA39CJC7_9EURO|nr:hypothetical protein H2200_004963 [Cladophialophora chaetospira]